MKVINSILLPINPKTLIVGIRTPSIQNVMDMTLIVLMGYHWLSLVFLKPHFHVHIIMFVCILFSNEGKRMNSHE